VNDAEQSEELEAKDGGKAASRCDPGKGLRWRACGREAPDFVSDRG
jgi:hypothetical protein